VCAKVVRLDSNISQNELSTVEINGIGEAMAIVRDFTKASDVEADILCMVIGKLYEFAFTWLKAQIAMAFGATNAPGSISTAINLYIDAGKAIGEGVAAAADIKANDKYMKTNDTHSGLRMVEKPTRGLCAAVGADKADEKFDRTTDMNKYIKEVFTNTRKGFEGSFGNLIRGNHSNAPGSLLGSYMSRPDVATAIDRLDHNSTGFEE
jgi:hypothetical protein